MIILVDNLSIKKYLRIEFTDIFSLNEFNGNRLKKKKYKK